MPAIDQLLQVVHERGGSQVSLFLEPGREARLRAGASERPLTRTPLDRATIERLLREVAPAPLAAGPDGRIEFRYALGTAEFRIVAVAADGGWQVTASRSPAGRAVVDGKAACTSPPVPPVVVDGNACGQRRRARSRRRPAASPPR